MSKPSSPSTFSLTRNTRKTVCFWRSDADEATEHIKPLSVEQFFQKYYNESTKILYKIDRMKLIEDNKIIDDKRYKKMYCESDYRIREAVFITNIWQF